MGWSGLRWQTKDRSKRLTKGGIGCSARTDWDGIEKDGFAYSATSTAAAVPASLNPVVRLPTGVVFALEKTQQGEVSGRRLAHSTELFAAASCVAQADIDAEDQPERNPQKGH